MFMNRKKSLLSSAVVLGLITPLLGLATASPASAEALCGVSPRDEDGSSWVFTGNGANQRTGSSTLCAITGGVQAWERLDYHCWTRQNSTYTWTYVRDDHSNTEGWVRDDLLSDNGSKVWCGW